jgi:hypothetical protein
MRKNIILLTISLLGIVIFFSCKKSDSNTPGSSNTSGSFIDATINGAAYKQSACVAVVEDSTLGIYGGATSTVNLAYPYIEMSVEKYKGVGTYTVPGVTGSLNNADVDSNIGAAVPYSGSYGTIIITTATSTNVAGTFSFTTDDSTKVTNGSFSAVVGQ